MLIPAACNDAFSSSDCTISDERIILSDELEGMWKEEAVALGRDEVGYCDICLEGLRKATKNFIQESRSPVLGRKVEFPEYEGVVLPQCLRR